MAGGNYERQCLRQPQLVMEYGTSTLILLRAAVNTFYVFSVVLRIWGCEELSQARRDETTHTHTHTWKNLVWERAWSLEEMYWRIEYRLQKSLDLVRAINPNPEYLTWWALSDKYPEYINMCETMARLVCHASLLKMDDVRLN